MLITVDYAGCYDLDSKYSKQQIEIPPKKFIKQI